MATTKDYGLGEFTFPRGWFMVADAEQLGMQPLCVRFFGRDMVLYRGESGKAYMVSAYCPHMRTHIGKSATSSMTKLRQQIVGESIRCPYHGWQFGPDGKCNRIPYEDIIPPGAKLEAFPVVERYNAIFYWNDPEGGPPDYDLPAIPEWDDPHYVRWHLDHLGAMNLHPIEVVDNICDVQHLSPIHAALPKYFETVIRGHQAWQLLGCKHMILGADEDQSEFTTYYTGPGILISKFHGDNTSVMFIAHTPIDDGKTMAWHATLTKIKDRVPIELDIKQAREYQKASLEAFAGDFEIWSNKEPCLQVMQTRRDGNFAKVRTWYKQFYNPRSAVPALLKRCEGRYTVGGIPSVENGNARPETLAVVQAE